MTRSTTSLDTAADTAAGVLAHARDRPPGRGRRRGRPAPRRLAWADLHPAESIGDAVRFGDTPVPVAGPGAPLVAEFCVAEFAAAVGLPTETGKAYLGEALELRHRLPRTWARVRAGDLAAWRARRIARATIALSPGGGGVRGRPGRGVRAPDPPQRRGPAGRGGDRAVHARRGPPPPGGRRGRPARPRAHRPGVLRGHRVGARPRSTWPTPWTWTPPSRPVPPGSPTSARPRRWTCAAPKRSGRWPGTSWRWTSTPRPRPTPRPDHRPDAARQVVLHVHLSEQAHHDTRGPAAPGPGGEHPLLRRRRPGPHLVRRARRAGDGEAGGRPDRAPPRGPVPGPRPARRPGRRAGPDLCVPVVHPPRRGLRHWTT